MTEPHKLPPCVFTWDLAGDTHYSGFDEGTTWNGFDNVSVTPETLAAIAEDFRKRDPEFDPADWQIPPGPNGLCSLAHGFATQIVSTDFTMMRKAFCASAGKLLEAMGDLPQSGADPIVSHAYPPYLPSFDEFYNDLLAWRDSTVHEDETEAARDRRLFLRHTVEMAIRFDTLLREFLTKQEYAEMKRLNSTDPAYATSSCASHNYCDANEFMSDAFTAVNGREMNPSNEADCALWNRAWEIARERFIGSQKG